MNDLLKKFIGLLGIDLLAKASGFILLPIYLYLMTQAQFGMFNYIISIVLCFSQVFNFGLYLAQTKLYHEYKDNERASTIYTINVLLLILLMVMLGMTYAFRLDFFVIKFLFKTPIDYDLFRIPILIAIIISVYSFMLVNFYLTAENVKLVKIYNIIKLLLLNTTIVLAMYFIKANHVFVRLLVTYFIEILMVLLFISTYIKSMQPVFNTRIAVRAVKIGLPIMASAILGIIISFGDKFFLEKKGGFIDLSIYYLAFSVANIIPTVFSTFQNIWIPIFLKEKDINKNIAMTKNVIIKAFFAMILISIILLGGIKFALFFSFINGKYNKIMYILPIILFSVSIEAISHLLINYVTYFENTFLLPLVSLFIGIVSIVLNIILIKTYGLYGAAASSVTLNLIAFFVYYIVVKNSIRIYKLKTNII